MNRGCIGVTMTRNCTLKADDVCSKFLQNGIPVLEGIPSTLAISYMDIVGVSQNCARMILRYCPDPVLVPRCFRTGADSVNGKTKRTRTRFQDKIRIRSV